MTVFLKFVISQDGLLTCIQDLPLADNAPGGMVDFRRALPASYFFKFFLQVAQSHPALTAAIPVDARELSAIAPYSRPLSRGSQVYDENQGYGEVICHSLSDVSRLGDKHQLV